MSGNSNYTYVTPAGDNVSNNSVFFVYAGKNGAQKIKFTLDYGKPILVIEKSRFDMLDAKNIADDTAILNKMFANNVLIVEQNLGQYAKLITNKNITGVHRDSFTPIFNKSNNTKLASAHIEPNEAIDAWIALGDDKELFPDYEDNFHNLDEYALDLNLLESEEERQKNNSGKHSRQDSSAVATDNVREGAILYDPLKGLSLTEKASKIHQWGKNHTNLFFEYEIQNAQLEKNKQRENFLNELSKELNSMDLKLWHNQSGKTQIREKFLKFYPEDKKPDNENTITSTARKKQKTKRN